MTLSTEARVPPGFRFHPTDEELISFYLKKKVSAIDKFDLDHVIREVDLNKLEPWDLRERCTLDVTHQTEWYFFSHNDKKYPTGSRTNRATAAGFWKATGRDKGVHSNNQRIGMRKTLVFYRGRAPHGQKTDWIMHEYRLEEMDSGSRNNEYGWVVCRVFKKRKHQEKPEPSHSNLSEEEQPCPSVATSGYSRNSQENALPVPSVETSGHSKYSQEGALPVKTFSCKQEVEECSARQKPFLQLPQLESPKVTSNSAPGNNPIDLKRTLADNCKKVEHSAAFFLDRPVMEGFNGRSFHVCESDLPDYADNGQLTDWNLLDNISRYNAELCSFSSDIPQYLIFTSKQQPLEYPSSCEVDLWNFTR